MIRTPLVSVLIPAYNASRHIGATLDSVAAQTWPNVEVIVVDDGSDDDTPLIVLGRNDDRIQLVRQGRRGPSAAQNEAFRRARGEFIQRLDADDFLAQRKIDLQMDRLRHEPRGIAVGEWARFVAQPDEAVFPDSSSAHDLRPIDWLVNACAEGLPMLQPGLWLASREMVEAAGPWDDELTLNNDFDYGVRLLLEADIVLACPGAKLYYRSGNPASLASRKSAEAWRSSLLSIERGAAAMLASRVPSTAVRRACANLFQQLAYSTYLDAPDVCEEAERHVTRLGGASIAMDGGLLFRVMRHTIGWRRASRVKRAAYRLGYDRVAAAKSQGRLL